MNALPVTVKNFWQMIKDFFQKKDAPGTSFRLGFEFC